MTGKVVVLRMAPVHRRARMAFRGVLVVVHKNPNGTRDVFLDRQGRKDHELHIRKPRHRRKRRP